MAERVQTKLELQTVQEGEDKVMNMQLGIHWLKTEDFLLTIWNWLVVSCLLSSKMVFFRDLKIEVGMEQETGTPILASNRLVEQVMENGQKYRINSDSCY